MHVHCQGCAGCCLDWRPLVEDPNAAKATPDRGRRRGPRRTPIDDVASFVPLTREDVRAFLEAGLGDALTPRLWEADAADESVTIDGYEVAAIAGRPAFFVGLRKPPKLVAPFDLEEPTWLPSCVFLDPTTLQCRIHDTDHYPAECRTYPAHTAALEAETECERVEGAFGGNRLCREGAADDGCPALAIEVTTAPDDTPLFGPQAIGQKLFTYPEPEALEGRLERLATDALTLEDRAVFVAVAAASAPGTFALSTPHRERARTQVLEADSWVGRACRSWAERAPEPAQWGTATDDDQDRVTEAVEGAHGAPETPGWDRS